MQKTPDEVESLKQIHYQLEYFESQQKNICNLYEKFAILKTFDGSKLASWVSEEVSKELQDIIDSKRNTSGNDEGK